ncbi:hypothetical protein OHA91_01110 [Streptomyces erythrochromogenes]|uniref:EF-hand domain-containing protein n=1 Tax=Streptomyces erythrochromogenes TaxID=285574 RepID=A0ABZ1Q4M3_9ACTN|nr:hypothetical protein [Streptomyces erythrochromogenes]MCX5583972.1 hypothetical protein [Streptomyces erythrochromogenes]
MTRLTTQVALGELYDHDLDAHFDTRQLREGLADAVSPGELDRIIAAVDATGDETVSYETVIALLEAPEPHRPPRRNGVP